MADDRTISIKIGDPVVVGARPRSYRATVTWVDRAWSGDPVKVQVKPHPGQNVSERARNVRARFILEVISNEH